MRSATLAILALLAIPPALFAQTSAKYDPDADRANLHYKLGWEALHSEDWAGAAKEFQQSIEIDKKFKLAFYGLGRSYMGLRQFPDAARVYEICRDMYRADAGDKFNNSMEADRQRERDQDELQATINQLSGMKQSQAVQIQLRQLHTYKDAIQMKRDQGRDVALNSYVPAFVELGLGSAYFRVERMTDAEREYKAAVEADPTIGEAHNNLAVLYMLTGRFDDSTREVKAAEKSGYRVNPQFKKDLEEKLRSK